MLEEYVPTLIIPILLTLYDINSLRYKFFKNSDVLIAMCAWYILDVLWGQPELCENQRNDLLFFEIVACHFCGASEVQT